MLLGRGKDEDCVCRRLLKGFEEGVEGLLGEHVDLIYDEDGILPGLRRNLHQVHQGLDILHSVVGRCIQLVDAVGTSLRERTAGLALPARLEVRPRVVAVDGLREDARSTCLAHSAGTAEEVGMCKLAPLDGVFEGPGDIVLAYQ